jgi:putative flippase GtrA
MSQALQTHARFRRLFTHVPAGQLWRFLLVGIWNTVFGYASFASFALLLGSAYPRYGYILAGAISSIVNISVAFLGYKWFVFKTKGNYLSEWTRCLAVYSSSIVIGMILLPLLVFALRRATPADAAAPYIAAALLACFNAVYNFLGNKKFTFQRDGISRVDSGTGT